MNPEQARKVIFDVLGDIAPEVDESTVDDDHDLTEQLDLDSMDYLNWMVGINEVTGVDIPQRDVSRFLTIAGAVAYLVEHSTESPSPGETPPRGGGHVIREHGAQLGTNGPSPGCTESAIVESTGSPREYSSE